MENRIVYLLLISLIITGFIYSTEAQRKFKKGEMVPPPNVLEQLNLTDTQKDKIEDLRFNHHKEMIELKAELQLKMLEMRKLKSSDDLNRSKVISMTKEINEIRNKISLARANHQMDIYEVLDNTQRKIWDENRPIRKWNKNRGMFRHWRNFCW